ncbi:MAG TPA: L-glyceraldehyde 3-phosphate reductase [Planctomycetes bacterium]|nr:L-glyceraldehyde 3-phosphate reductase [Planctomycetota bacterium]
MTFAPERYQTMPYRRCGRSGLQLPAISLGLWQGTGSYVEEQASRRIVFTAFDHGITHFDLANNYGSPAGASEELFGRIVRDLPRHEVVVSSKAGYRMWPGPYGDGGSRKYLIESCEQSLRRLGLDHVDIFYSHRLDPETPLEETMGALETLVRQGKALYAGVSNYPDPWFTRALGIMRQRAWAPITIHQPCYNLLNRAPEREVLPTAAHEGIGVIAFSPLAQGLLTGKYLDGIPADSRAASAMGNGAIGADRITPEILARVRGLHRIAQARGQSLAQMALAWLLRDSRVTSVLIGASKPEQVTDNVGSLANLHFDPAELAEIDAACAAG